MNPIRVMHVRTSGGLYGAERVILSLLNNVDRRRYELLLLCIRDRDGDCQPFVRLAQAAGGRVLWIDDRRKLDLRAIAAIRRAVRNERVQIVHSHDFKADLYALLASIDLPVKRVVSAHGVTHDSFGRRVRLYVEEHMLYRAFDVVVAVAAHLRTHLLRFLDPHVVKLVQNGIDLRLLHQPVDAGRMEVLPPGDGRPVFVVVGRLLPDKGHRFFLDAFAELLQTHPRCTAWIVGDGPERPAIAAQVQALGLKNDVHLCGVRAEMRSVYERASFLVLPSLTEGLPMVLLEALAWKLPVVATRVGDVPLLVQRGLSGHLVAPGDPATLAQAMRSLLDRPDEARRMADAAYALLRERFTAERMALDTQVIYGELLAR